MLKRIARSFRFRSRSGLLAMRRRWDQTAEAFRPREPTKFNRFLQQVVAVTGGLEGKRLLEIGSDGEGTFIRQAVEIAKVSEAVGVNPSFATSRAWGRARLLNCDARAMAFPNGRFDVITAMSAFEHVHRLDEVLAECHRVMAPGALLITEFAPIWSGCWGHHLWFYYNGKIVDWTTHPLPPYAHLLMSREEVSAWCDERYGDPLLSGAITQYVFDSPDQNRMFYSDYLDAFEASALNVVCIGAFADVPFPPHVPVSSYVELFAKLKERYPDKSGFGHQGMIAILAKPSR